ncbi:MAG: uroporphyrinogen-III C-methyltransferase [Tissierellia bacterium]|nr:uroporphyrinogen-III C-methyltransferase [Tissierellia bacterium]
MAKTKDTSPVILAGAGIGSEKNITLAVLEALRGADAIVYDRLINPHILDDFQNRELIYVGKAASRHAMKQDEINATLVRLHREGKSVVRLKGGDPYVFGRGSEEALYLKEHGVPFEVLPGLTSGVAVLNTAGIPATHRNMATSVSFITGHLAEDAQASYAIYGKLKGTLVFYMGLGRLGEIAQGLMEGGMDPKTPIAVIMDGGWNSQRSMDATLDTVVEKIEPLNFSSPALIVVGDVISLREELNFFENRPLFGKTIVITRPRHQASRLQELLSQEGAEVVSLPTIAIEAVGGEALRTAMADFNYSHLLFTSVNGVDLFFREFFKEHDIRELAGVKICVIGKKTKERVEKLHLQVDAYPETYVGEAFVEAVAATIEEGSEARLFFPHAEGTRKKLLDALKQLGDLTQVVVYRSVAPREPAALPQNFDAAVFTSSSTVKNFIELYGREALEGREIFSIGSITTDSLISLGFTEVHQSKEATIESIVEKIRSTL